MARIKSFEIRNLSRSLFLGFKKIKTTVKLINMGTSEELLKCRLSHFSLGYAADSLTVVQEKQMFLIQFFVVTF